MRITKTCIKCNIPLQGMENEGECCNECTFGFWSDDIILISKQPSDKDWMFRTINKNKQQKDNEQNKSAINCS